MNALFKRFSATAIMLGVLVFPQFSVAKGFTGADILKWDEASQNSYFHTSLGMAGVIASQNRQEAARCIDEWYFSNEITQKQRNEHLLSMMRKFPKYHPQTTIFAVLTKTCGALAK